MSGLIVDNFAGGGGASTGIEAALNRAVDIAVDHDRAAIDMHRANHPGTLHLCEDVFSVSPREVCAGRPIDVAWFSPDCRHHSNAKAGKPVSRRVRGLADGTLLHRMLTSREVALAQGFPASYVLTGGHANEIKCIGNSVCPPVAEALVRANCAWAIAQEAGA